MLHATNVDDSMVVMRDVVDVYRCHSSPIASHALEVTGHVTIAFLILGV
jgi:hypothetical protein